MSEMYSNSAEMASISNQPNPLLVKLYHTHGFQMGEANDISFDERIELCDDVTRLIEQSQKPADKEMASDILIALLRHAEKNLKQAMAERFSVMDNVPLRLMLQFVNDEIDVAKPILTYSNALNDLDLLYIIQSRDSPFWQAIAARKNLGENVVDALVDTHDIATSKTLVENVSVTLTDYATGVISELSKDNSELANALLARSEITEEMSRILYAYVGDELKQKMAEAYDALTTDEQETFDEVVDEFTATPHPTFLPTASMLKAADLFMEQGKLSTGLMINTVKRGQLSSFIAQFSRYIGLPVAVVIPMLQQKNGQALAVASRAVGIDRNDFLVMFNFTRKISGQDFATSSDINSALTYFDRVTPELAKRLMLQNKN